MKAIFDTAFYISEFGEVISSDGKRVPTQLNGDGYECVTLRTSVGRKTFRVHRLVAIRYIKNKDSKPEVNHKDGIKTNNNLSNLEWVTHSENIKHAWDNGLLKSTPERSYKISLTSAHLGIDNHNSKRVIGKTPDGEATRIFECMIGAAKEYNTDSSQVSKSANNVLTKSGNKRFAGRLNGKPLYWDFVP